MADFLKKWAKIEETKRYYFSIRPLNPPKYFIWWIIRKIKDLQKIRINFKAPEKKIAERVDNEW